MSDFNRGFYRPAPAGTDMSVDAGLRSFMLGVYNKVALGLVLSGVLAWLTSHEPVRDYLFRVVETPRGLGIGYTPLGMALAFAPLVVILGSRFLMRTATPQNSGALYWTIVSLMGASMGVLLLAYTGQSVATTFFVTAAAFGGLSLFGYTTKKDLSGFGSFLFIGLIGIVIASVVNMFLHSSVVAFTVSVLGVLIFAGLIAWRTQNLKMTYYQIGGDSAAMGVATNYGALGLYVDFINLFQFLLSFMGNRR
jgi:FtsH-binding integral membrane protein